MPKDEFDFDDPLELKGVALYTNEDTSRDMAECFIEEFLRLGYSHKQLLALFRNPHYLGMNMVLQNKGEPFVKEVIREVFARWGKTIQWHVPANLPLTPALSPSDGERENCRQPVDELSANADSKDPSLLFPRPLGGGEGQGEGATKVDLHVNSPLEQAIALDDKCTDPLGNPVPRLNL